MEDDLSSNTHILTNTVEGPLDLEYIKLLEIFLITRPSSFNHLYSSNIFILQHTPSISDPIHVHRDLYQP
jgi:hypothetical protein